mgnify:CR=1 FL=1
MSATLELLRAAQEGDRDACEQAVIENNGLIWSVVRRYYGRGVDPEDLYQLGCLGFLKAVQGFDFDYGTCFSTYAVPKIAGEIRRFLRDDGAVKVGRTMREQAQTLYTIRERLRQELKLLLLPKDPNDRKNVILEIRAGTGGEEAALFAASLLRMYTMYAAARGWRTDTVELNETELGGVKECSVLIEGEGAWSRLKFESGVHRVQRVPVTESNGRIQTSAATVAVLPEAEGVDVKLDPADIEMQVYRASGAGGQHVNKTSSAVRLIHRPTGMVVECQQERSQFQNRDRAMRILASRLYEAEQEKRSSEFTAERRSQVGTGMRNERIRTYNFPQGRVTDHRIGLTLYKIESVMDGDLDELMDALAAADQAERLKQTQ